MDEMNNLTKKLFAAVAVALMVASATVILVRDSDTGVAVNDDAYDETNVNDNIVIDDDTELDPEWETRSVRYDKVDGVPTLTLTNAKLSFKVGTTLPAGIFFNFDTYTGDVHIVLKGTNTITIASDSSGMGSSGINSYGSPLYIKGGSMTKDSLSVKVHSEVSTPSTMSVACISCDKDMHIRDCEINCVLEKEKDTAEPANRAFSGISGYDTFCENVKLNVTINEDVTNNHTLLALSSYNQASYVNSAIKVEANGKASPDSYFFVAYINNVTATFDRCVVDVEMPNGAMAIEAGGTLTMTFKNYKTMSIYKTVGSEPEVDRTGEYVVPIEDSKWAVEKIDVISNVHYPPEDDTALFVSVTAVALIAIMALFIVLIGRRRME